MKKKVLIGIVVGIVLLISIVVGVVLLISSNEDYEKTSKYSKGLIYYLNDDGESYSVCGIGSCKDDDIVIPSEYKGKPVTIIESYAFAYCSSITSVKIPDSVTNIEQSAFYRCTSLESVTIPDSVTNIEDFAFSECTSLKSIVVDKDNQYYKSMDGNLYTRDGKILTQYAIGKKETSFAIPNSVTSIAGSAFSDCKYLTSIEIPNSVTTIGYFSFADCPSLTSVVIPNSVTTIKFDAFRGCTLLTIYCEATSEPRGWDYDWNSSNCPVVWGYTGE